VTRPTNFHRLETRYKLIRYELPEILYRVSKNNCMTYSQVQNSLYEQLDCPYKLYKHDRLDGDEKWVVYALYPRYGVPATVMLPLFSDVALPAREIAFEQLDLYSLLSLLQIVYCRNGRAWHFIGQDLCYVLGKHTDTCLSVQKRTNGRSKLSVCHAECSASALAESPRSPFPTLPGRRSIERAAFSRLSNLILISIDAARSRCMRSAHIQVRAHCVLSRKGWASNSTIF
jgi:hypothetical protein